MEENFNPYAAPVASSLPPSSSEGELPMASRWQRFAASLVDSVILLLILMPVEWAAGAFQRQRGMFHPEHFLWSAVGFGIILVVNWSFLLNGQTLGKWMLGIKIVRKDGSPCDRKRIILQRLLPLQLAVLIPIAGFLIALVDTFSIFRSSRYMLHDDVADTKVVRLPTA